MSKWVIGVIGGSGLYEIEGLEGAENVTIDTPWGAPSDALVKGYVGDVEFVFLPRHGQGLRLPPTTVPYRANIDALKRLGCTDILSISACGSLQEQYAPGEFVMGDRFTAPDIGTTYIAQMAERLGEIGPFPNLASYLARNTARPAFQRALEKTGG